MTESRWRRSCGLDDKGIRARTSEGTGDCATAPRRGTYSALYSKCTGNYFPGREWNHICLMQMLRMRGAKAARPHTPSWPDAQLSLSREGFTLPRRRRSRWWSKRTPVKLVCLVQSSSDSGLL
jgi:hypothetical protein